MPSFGAALAALAHFLTPVFSASPKSQPYVLVFLVCLFFAAYSCTIHFSIVKRATVHGVSNKQGETVHWRVHAMRRAPRDLGTLLNAKLYWHASGTRLLISM